MRLARSGTIERCTSIQKGRSSPPAVAISSIGAYCASSLSVISSCAGSRHSGALALSMSPRRNSARGVPAPGAPARPRASAKPYTRPNVPQTAGSFGP